VNKSGFITIFKGSKLYFYNKRYQGETMNTAKNNVEKFEWSIQIPIFKNPVILKQLGIAIGIPFGLLLIFFFIVSTPENRIYSLYALGAILLLFLLTYLFIILVYKGKYSVSFILDDKGIQSFTQADMVKKNKIINGLTIGLGLLAGKPTVAGAGMLANSKQTVGLKWNKVQRVKYNPRQNTILLRGNPMENIGVFCTPENYLFVEAFIKNKLTN
jgi:hypothetical protein